jgi:steroid delta-isomerase-like uncharacterized protein
MAQAKSRGARGADEPSSEAVNERLAETAEPKPVRRRISRRKQVEQHVRAYFEALSRRDVEAVAEFWSEDGVADIVSLGILRGRAEITGLFCELFAAVPDLQTIVTRVVAGEHEAAVEWRMNGHFTGQAFQGVEATGRWVELRGIDVIEIANGKNSSATAYYDGMSFARQIGLMPPRDSGPERALKGAFNAATKVRRTIRARRAGG